MLIRLFWPQYFNSCHNDFNHLILTVEHKNLSITTDSTFLSFVSWTGKFIPASPVNQLIMNVKRSLHVLCGFVNSELLKQGITIWLQGAKLLQTQLVFPIGSPKFFYFQMREEKSRFNFLNHNNVWLETRGLYWTCTCSFYHFCCFSVRYSQKSRGHEQCP